MEEVGKEITAVGTAQMAWGVKRVAFQIQLCINFPDNEDFPEQVVPYIAK